MITVRTAQSPHLLIIGPHWSFMPLETPVAVEFCIWFSDCYSRMYAFGRNEKDFQSVPTPLGPGGSLSSGRPRGQLLGLHRQRAAPFGCHTASEQKAFGSLRWRGLALPELHEIHSGMNRFSTNLTYNYPEASPGFLHASRV